MLHVDSDEQMDVYQMDVDEQEEIHDVQDVKEQPRPISREEQLKALTSLEATGGHSLEVGQTWYVVSMAWIRKWSEYVNAKDDDIADPPGPITNSDILHGNDLMPYLSDKIDYEILHSEIADLFYGWYGGTRIGRKVVLNDHNRPIVEIYPAAPLDLTIIREDDNTRSKLKIAPSASVATLVDTICTKLNIDKQQVRVWDWYQGKPYALLDSSSTRTLEKSKIIDKNEILVEFKDALGKWARADPVSMDSSMNYRYPRYNYSDSQEGTPQYRGLVGLKNLGNTCYMNSALQCLSNTLELSNYFLANRQEAELNRTNVLGTGGELAIEYGKLIHKMHGNQYTVVAPREFKLCLGRHAEQFAGYSQHDSQELLGFLLDRLHEDLNLVITKPIVAQIESDGTEVPSEVATKSWENHLKRNQSIIVNMFQGQFKSKVTCPVETCKKISITYDPMMYLSLPLPSEGERDLKVNVLFEDGSPLKKYKLKVNKLGKVFSVKEALSAKTGVPPDCFELLDIFSKKVYSEFLDNMMVTDIGSNDVVVAHVVNKNASLGWHAHHMYFKTTAHSGPYGNNCIDPMMISIQTGVTTLKDIKESVIRRLKSRYFRKDASADTDDDFFEIHKGKKQVRGSRSEETRPLRSVEEIIHANDALYIILDDSKIWDLFDESLCAHPIVIAEDDDDEPTSPSIVNLFHCLDKFVSEEILGETDMWYCSRCKEHRRAKKKMDIWKLPPYLVVHIKRFQYDGAFRDKIDTLVDFPFDLDLTSYVLDPDCLPPHYSLYAVSNHFGGLGGGHYTAFCKNDASGKWFNFDDSSVSEITDLSSIVSSSAYLLFYKRVSGPEDVEDVDMSGVAEV